MRFLTLTTLIWLHPIFVSSSISTVIGLIPRSDSTSHLTYVTLEEHWVSSALKNLTLSNPVVQLLLNGTFPSSLGPALLDMSSQRLANMTANGIRKQVVSNTPAPAALDQPVLVTQANNELAAAVAQYPDRFNAWAFLPMAYPELAAQELKRCVTELGFVGGLVDNHLANGTYYDGYGYWPFWEKVQELGVPLYLHPTIPNTTSVTGVGSGVFAPAYSLNFPLTTAADLGTIAWGFHEDTGLHLLRLYVAGIFDQYPNLKIVLGHMGEIMPFMLERSSSFLSPLNTSRSSLIDVWARNAWITTSGFFSLNTIATILRNTAIDRIMYSVDYPFSSNVAGTQFMVDLKTSGMVTMEEWSMIAHRNAEALLNIS